MKKDTYTKVKCPACGKQMSKIMLDSTDFYIDICADGCGGLFLDDKELTYLLKNKEAYNEVIANIQFSNSLILLGDKTYEEVNDSQTRFCPVCGSMMIKNNVKNAIVSIDRCQECGVIFLDLAEFEELHH